MDCRYNVIQWVHRSTRGWSYGSSVTDPRTGEIIKGHVSLGSLRVRQDYLIGQSLIENPYLPQNKEKVLEMSLARIRQLSAHEVGHTLGFAHNFSSSTKQRSSVMDYPHPLIKIKDDKINLDSAYAIGIGEWDKISVAYSYSEFKDNQNEKLSQTVNLALNSTLSRTLNTSLTTLLVLLAIFIFGGESIRGFMFALIVGVIVGTYSSVFIATPVMFDTQRGEIIKN